MTHGPSLVIRCPAKVNLSLQILGLREDGYHELRTVYQAIDLWDELEARDSSKLTLECDDPAIPVDESNLVLKAAAALQRASSGIPCGAALRLRKRIPAGGGLGGGSSDAAAALVLLARLWGLSCGRDYLVGIAAGIGSDVPFFLHGGTAVGEGRGERITPVPFYGQSRLLLGFPPFGVSTARAYAQTRLHLTAPPPDGKFQRFPNGKWPGSNDFQLGRNDLEPVVFGMHPELRAFRDALIEGGAGSAMLSGSGSTVFGMFDDEEGMRRAREMLAGPFEGWRLLETRAVADGPRWVGGSERRGYGTRGISE